MTTTLESPVSATPVAKRNPLHLLARLGPLLGLVSIIILFSVLRPRTFANLGNAQIILMQTAVVGTAALGATMIIISAGIDISVGSVIALTAVVISLLLKHGWPPLLAAIGGVAVGCLTGLVSGTLITRLRLLPFIVTLALLAGWRGLGERLANEQTVDAPATWLNQLISMLPANQQWMLVAPGVWMTLVLALFAAAALRYTRFGRHVFAIGSNEQTARLCGVNVARTKILIYCLGGMFSGLAGVLQFSSLTVGDSTTAMGLELDIIAAVVIGGASLNGGEGSIFGSLIGALIMSVLANGCAKLGLKNPDQLMVTCGIILVAVTIDGIQHRKRQASRG